MHTNVFSVFLAKLGIFVSNRADLFRVERAITVYDIDAVGTAFSDHFKRLINIRFLCIGDCHDVTGYFVSLCLCILDHFNCSRHLMYVSSDAHHINDTVLAVNNVLFVIATSNVRHNRDFHVGIVVTNDRTDIFFITEFPLAKFIYIK